MDYNVAPIGECNVAQAGVTLEQAVGATGKSVAPAWITVKLPPVTIQPLGGTTYRAPERKE